MHRLIAGVTMAATLAVVTPGTAAGQVPGIPVYNTPIASGFAIAADFGFPNDASGLGTSYAITGLYGTGPFGFTATLGGTKVEAINKTEVTLGGTVNWKVFGGPLVPVAINLQAGIAYWKGVFDSDNIRVPVGVGFVYTIPTEGMAIKPWAAPRVDYTRASVSGSSADATEFGLSAGVDLAFLSGLGVRGAWDGVFASGSTISTFGVGINYAFRVPGG